jgi:hypothetical protein
LYGVASMGPPAVAGCCWACQPWTGCLPAARPPSGCDRTVGVGDSPTAPWSGWAESATVAQDVCCGAVQFAYTLRLLAARFVRHWADLCAGMSGCDSSCEAGLCKEVDLCNAQVSVRQVGGGPNPINPARTDAFAGLSSRSSGVLESCLVCL